MTQIIINGVTRQFNIDRETFEILRLALLDHHNPGEFQLEEDSYIPEFIEITTIEGDKCIINTHAITFVG